MSQPPPPLLGNNPYRPHNNNNSNNNKPAFKLPSRAELEERRRQVESLKPTSHFRPSGIASSSSDVNATKNEETLSAAPSTATTTTKTTVPPSRAANHEDDFGDVDLMALDDLFEEEFDGGGGSSSSRSTRPPTLVGASAGAAKVGTAVAGVMSAPGSITASGATATGATVVAPPLPPPFVPKSKSTVVVKTSQRGNPLLQFVRNVPYEYGEIVPDYVVGVTSCILFLSIRYHRLHPEYIFNRISALGKTFVLRVLLVLVDVETHQAAIRELTRVGLVNDLTVICVWSNEEAGRYIETFKAYENKAPDAIMERVENDYLSKLSDALTRIQSINKTDVVTLSSTFGSLKNIMDASVDELGVLPGFGERKVKRLLEAFDQPFAIDPKKRRHRRR